MVNKNVLYAGSMAISLVFASSMSAAQAAVHLAGFTSGASVVANTFAQGVVALPSLTADMVTLLAAFYCGTGAKYCSQKLGKIALGSAATALGASTIEKMTSAPWLKSLAHFTSSRAEYIATIAQITAFANYCLSHSDNGKQAAMIAGGAAAVAIAAAGVGFVSEFLNVSDRTSKVVTHVTDFVRSYGVDTAVLATLAAVYKYGVRKGF